MNNSRIKFYLTAALSVAMVLFSFWIAIDWYKTYTSEKDVITQETQALEQDLEEANSIPLEDLQAQVEALRIKVPTTPSLETIIDQVSTLATANGLVLTTGTPTSEQSSTADPSTVQSSTVVLTLEGSLAGTQQFLQDLNSIDRLVSVNSVEMLQTDSTAYQTRVQLTFYSKEAL